MKVLVAGGAGFIGSNVVDAYIKAGHEVVVVDDLSSGKMENVNAKAEFHRMDVRSTELRELVRAQRPDVINIHAAQISVPYSVEDPFFDADVNIKGLLNIAEAVRHTGTGKIIFISSGGAIYGAAPEYPTTELCPTNPISPYAIAKDVCERYIEFYNRQYGIDYTVLRYANIYGPRQIPQAEAGVVSIFIDNILGGRPSAIYHFDGEPEGMLRDYCFVGDVVKANLLALEKGSGQAFNIGTGVATCTAELFGHVFSSLKKMLPEIPSSLGIPSKGPARMGDLRRSCLNIDKARSVFGWSPATTVAQGVEQTVRWALAERQSRATAIA